MRDEAKLLPLLVEHDLLPPGGVRGWKAMRDRDVLRYAAFLPGVSVWLTAVECGVAQHQVVGRHRRRRQASGPGDA